MKKDQLLPAMLKGIPLAVVEYRGASATYSKAGNRTWQGRTYESAESVTIVHRVELAGIQHEIREKLQRDNLPKDAALFAQQFSEKPLQIKIGSMAVWHIKGYSFTDGKWVCSGHLENLE